jgi:glycine/D-amino acid oxidase-like deaminating enzyme
MRTRLVIVSAVLLASGCGSPRIAPVSGVVTLNGKPLAGAIVSFQPIKEDKGPGKALPTSSGTTDENGAYTLKTTTDQEGALVGRHTVSIIRINPQAVNRDTRHVTGTGLPPPDSLPDRYNEKSELTCEVPPEGKRDANFALKSP